MKFSRHQDGDICPGCEDRLKQAHPYMADWFRFHKQLYKNAHISWAFRDEQSQHQALIDGASNVDWPKSKHNHMENGKPCSLALDIFQQINGKGVFDPMFCARLNETSKKNGFAVRWGNKIKVGGGWDYNHFQMDEAIGLHLAG